MNFDAIDEADDKYMVHVGVASALIKVMVPEGSMKLVPHISRELPKEYRGCVMWSALKALKIEGVVDYDEYKPAPTRVYGRSMRRVIPRVQNPYNRTEILPSASKGQPFPDVMFGRNHKGQI
jgi:hypothetical protein